MGSFVSTFNDEWSLRKDLKQMATADKSILGVNDPRCLQLAIAHSVAVDFAKNGTQVDASVLKLIHVQEWPDFMQRDERQTYPSEKVLGKLFRQALSAPTQARPQSELIPWEDTDIVAPHLPELEVATRPVFETYRSKIRNLALTYGLWDLYADLTCHFAIQHEVGTSDESRDLLSDALELGSALDAIEKETRRSFATISQSLAESGHFADISMAKQALAAYWYRLAHQPDGDGGPNLSFGYVMADEICKLKASTSKGGKSVSANK
jgi:RNA-dependent RNA polymerase